MIDNQKILLKFIQTNKNVNWSSISYNYKLSENFIQEFQDKLIGGIYQHIKIYQKTLYVNLKIKSIGIGYQYIKNYQNLLFENFNMKSIGIIYLNPKNYQKILFKNFNIKLNGI